MNPVGYPTSAAECEAKGHSWEVCDECSIEKKRDVIHCSCCLGDYVVNLKVKLTYDEYENLRNFDPEDYSTCEVDFEQASSAIRKIAIAFEDAFAKTQG